MFAAAGALLALFLFAPVFRNERPAGSAAEWGEALYKEGEYGRAAEILALAYERSPHDRSLQLSLARALYSSGNYKSALAALQGNDSEEAALLRAEAHLALGQFADAEAGTLGRHGGRWSFLAARLYYARGDAAAASRALAAALRHSDETLAAAWLLRARIGLDDDRTDEARSAIARAEEAGADASLITAYRIETLIRDGEFDGAAKAIAELRRLTPTASGLIAYLEGALAAALGRYIEAGRHWNEFAATPLADTRMTLSRAAVKAGGGDAAQAQALFEQALRDRPGDWVTLDAAAAFFTKTGDHRRARETVTALEKLAPALGRMRGLALFLAEGDVDGAVIAARAAHDTGQARRFWADILFGEKSEPARRDRAYRASAERLFTLVRAMDRAPAGEGQAVFDPATDNAAGLVLLGDLKLALGDEPRAREAYLSAAALAPAAWTPLEGLTRLDARRGGYAAAEERLAAFLLALPGANVEPASALPARLALARARRSQGDMAGAASALAPVAEALAGQPGEAVFYARVLERAGKGETLAEFARAARRASPAAPETVRILHLAGLEGEAAVAARRALANKPDDPARRRAYLAAMGRLGRQAEAIGVLAALPPAREPGEARPATLAEARAAYWRSPGDPAAARQYGTLLEELGRPESGTVLRDACFWSTRADCGGESGEET